MLSRLQHRRDFSEVGIGLKHVVECIHLYFLPGSELEVFSNAGQGVVVQLKLIKMAITNT